MLFLQLLFIPTYWTCKQQLPAELTLCFPLVFLFLLVPAMVIPLLLLLLKPYQAIDQCKAQEGGRTGSPSGQKFCIPSAQHLLMYFHMQLFWGGGYSYAVKASGVVRGGDQSALEGAVQLHSAPPA